MSAWSAGARGFAFPVNIRRNTGDLQETAASPQDRIFIPAAHRDTQHEQRQRRCRFHANARWLFGPGRNSLHRISSLRQFGQPRKNKMENKMHHERNSPCTIVLPRGAMPDAFHSWRILFLRSVGRLRNGEMGYGDVRPAPQAAAGFFIGRRAIDPSQNDDGAAGQRFEI